MIGTESDQLGVVLNNDRFQTIKKAVATGDTIPKHHHPGNQVVFICTQGQIDIFLDDDEVHHLHAGSVLGFAGEHYINGKALQDAEVCITLIKD
ncbi:hypothetical protein FC83_GL001645 [Agrilactobacillus composti DSM 18527 = JCM 14202]|uniref:Cupin 2 conserved barrel domain-containing protein n=1 Tax=Agrilactobacillus composti DSM 18527 = JCM 14202 TaxID=1423734 RepID=X0QIJ4_9LACO|nr:hypothetical protein [Agrilactobacillus composti]KRM30511.1 hypothetical protein FC83_GL001645 [Agrilactobacillus composti DSM 18527 = JCM 14202]GAF38430.1 hypothetical protein JCM14202_238 [Agrilactobacillus composti DSM 18527 = JCM 14202]